MGIQGEVSALRYGRWFKVIATVTAPSGARHWIKMSFHDYGRQLLRQEGRGYRDLRSVLSPHYRLPSFSLICDSREKASALFGEVTGTRLRAWQYPKTPITLLAGVRRTVTFDSWTNTLLDSLPPSIQRERLERCSERLVRNCRGCELKLGSSHGDFSSWNLLESRNETPHLALLDLEYYSPERPILFDDWHWFVGTLIRRAIRHRVEPLLVGLTSRLPALLRTTAFRSRYAGSALIDLGSLDTMKLYLATYLLERSVILQKEREMGNIVACVGAEEYDQCTKTVRLLGRMLDCLCR